jgi:hypothetical protein
MDPLLIALSLMEGEVTKVLFLGGVEEGELVSDLLLYGIRFMIRSNMGLCTSVYMIQL